MKSKVFVLVMLVMSSVGAYLLAGCGSSAGSGSGYPTASVQCGSSACVQ